MPWFQNTFIFKYHTSKHNTNIFRTEIRDVVVDWGEIKETVYNGLTTNSFNNYMIGHSLGIVVTPNLEPVV